MNDWKIVDQPQGVPAKDALRTERSRVKKGKVSKANGHSLGLGGVYRVWLLIIGIESTRQASHSGSALSHAMISPSQKQDQVSRKRGSACTLVK